MLLLTIDGWMEQRCLEMDKILPDSCQVEQKFNVSRLRFVIYFPRIPVLDCASVDNNVVHGR